MANPMHCDKKIMGLIFGAVAIIAAYSHFNIMPLKADSRLISCPILAEKFSIGAINFDAQKKCISDTGPVMTYERWCSRAPGVVCPTGRG